MNSAELLRSAQVVLDRPESGLEGVWPRTAAYLGRQSLEAALDAYWTNVLPNMRDANRRTQLICLEQFMNDKVIVDGVRIAWGSLSRVCHHHPYELAPTATELEAWLSQVERLVMSLR